MRIIVDKSVPKEVRDCALPIIKRFSKYAPNWLNIIRVFWDSENPDATATMTTQYEYRNCALTLCPYFFNSEPSERERTIRHEIMHLYTTPIKAEAYGCIQKLFGSEYPTAGCAIAEEAINKVHEAMTEDLAIFTERLDA